MKLSLETEQRIRLSYADSLELEVESADPLVHFSPLHMLAASRHAAYCLPTPGQIDTTAETKELDHLLAAHFGWWDVLTEKRKPV